MARLKPLVIDRAMWLHGRQLYKDEAYEWPCSLDSSLRSPVTGQMCCLGHLGRAVGVPVSAMTMKGMPFDLEKKYAHLFPKAPRSFYRRCAMANDSYAIKTDAIREQKIKDLFRQIGFKVTFTGKSAIKKARRKPYAIARSSLGLL